MELSGPSIEVKIVLLVAVALLVQDGVLVAMFRLGATPQAMMIVLGAILVLALIITAVWGNTVARAIRRLTRACFVARQGDVNVLTELPRTDELASLNSELNELIILLRDCEVTRAELSSSRSVADALEGAAPDLMRASQELLVSLKELREGASAEVVILRKIASSLSDARVLIEQVIRDPQGVSTDEDVATKLKSLGTLAKELELLADEVVDEVARPDIDEVSLARAVNGMRDSARTMTDVASQAAVPLERRRADVRTVSRSSERLRAAEAEETDGGRVAELMERSAATGLGAATRLASALRRLGVVLEAYGQRRRPGE